MAKKWREFEELVARIEQQLGPEGATVKSPDYILDKVTGSRREVDASIRYRVGSVPILITVECRDRSDSEDATWIEQLATKRHNIGAAKTVAVSSCGFTQPAIECAESHGIEIRLIDEITDEDILAWANKLEISVANGTYKLGSLHIETYKGNDMTEPRLEPAVEEEYRKHGLNAGVITRNRDGIKLTIANLLRQCMAGRGHSLKRGEGTQITLPPGGTALVTTDPGLVSLFEGIPFDGTVVKKTVWFEFPHGEVHVATADATSDVRKLTFEIELSQRLERVPLTRAISYSNASESIADIAETEFNLGAGSGPNVVISRHRITDSY